MSELTPNLTKLSRPMEHEIGHALARLPGQSQPSSLFDPSGEGSWGTEIVLASGDLKLNLYMINDRRAPGLLLSIWRIHEDDFPILEWVKLLEEEDVEICLFAAIAAVNRVIPPPRAYSNRCQSDKKSGVDSEEFASDSFSYLMLHSEIKDGLPEIKLKIKQKRDKTPEEIGIIPQDCLVAFIHGLQEGWYKLLETAEIGGAE